MVRVAGSLKLGFVTASFVFPVFTTLPVGDLQRRWPLVRGRFACPRCLALLVPLESRHCRTTSTQRFIWMWHLSEARTTTKLSI